MSVAKRQRAVRYEKSFEEAAASIADTKRLDQILAGVIWGLEHDAERHQKLTPSGVRVAEAIEPGTNAVILVAFDVDDAQDPAVRVLSVKRLAALEEED